MKQYDVDLVYTGRSGRFTKDKIYRSRWTYTGRGGIKSPSTWLFTLAYSGYRITPYELRRYWKYKDPSKLMSLCLIELYVDTGYIHDLIYSKNPLLSMISKGSGFKGRYLPIPIVYGD